MPYTEGDARREVGDSEDWLVGLEASIKKWEQRVRGIVNSYDRKDPCGLCFVKRNRKQRCPDCPAQPICRSLSDLNNKEVLQALTNLRKEIKMDCSKVCANFKPKNESPFPDGLRTEDLKVGMVARKGNRHDGFIYTIFEQPGDVWVWVLRAGRGCTAKETNIGLADHGCQPYDSGRWNHSNWLREVK